MKRRLLNLAISVDQLIFCLITLGESDPDETMSAAAWRLEQEGKLAGRIFRPLIDLLFFWQGPGHCKNAYIKEFERKNYPDEYRQGTPIFERRAR